MTLSPPSFPLRAVQRTRDFARILALPRRKWVEGGFTLRVSESLRRPGSTAMLRDIQAQALFELWLMGGTYAPISVGVGKTLISLLAPTVLREARPLLLVPAKLVDKTRREMARYAKDWRVCLHIRIESYQRLGHPSGASLLDTFRPGLIMGDESHKLKNPKTGVTQRVMRYIRENPETRVLLMTGTYAKRSLFDYAHLLKLCLPAQALPIPQGWNELVEWAAALDDSDKEPLAPGALLDLCDGTDVGNAIERARAGFRRRLTETAGFVATSERFLGASLFVDSVQIPNSPAAQTAFSRLRTLWERPDGWAFTEAAHVKACARQLAVGFYYRWDPHPPLEWLEVRRLWSRVCRMILQSNGRNLDTASQVVRAVDAGHYPHAVRALQDWREIEPTFKPNTVPVWLDTNALDVCAEWAHENPGIVWVEHVAFGEALSVVSGLPYYGAGGLDRGKRYIEAHPPGKPLIASIESNYEGRNLQAWSENLIVGPIQNGMRLEQVLGRTHRDGQKEDEVNFRVAFACTEHEADWYSTIDNARYIEQTTGQQQKILYADCEIGPFTKAGPAWQ